MSLGLYRALTSLAAPVVRVVLARRAAAGKEDEARIDERYGRAGFPRPAGPLVWLHAASVGESLSVLSLVEKLLADRPDLHAVVTTGTVTSAELMARRLPDRAVHQYVPVDLAPAVRRFLDHWRPQLACWVESEFWPNLILETEARGIPLLLLNARVSDRAFANWNHARGTISRLLSSFALCLAQSERDAERLGLLGARNVRFLGNLKFAAAQLPADAAELAALSRLVGSRPRWLASSTHEGEERIAGRVHRSLAPRFPGLLTVIAPRHPGRAAAVAEQLKAEGLGVARRSLGESPAAGTDVYLADTMGELGLFYRLCPLVFVGGSLVPHGGHNLLEPAALGCAVIHGPHMHNFRAIAREMGQAGASAEVADEAALVGALEGLLRDPALGETRGGRAAEAASKRRAVLDRVAAEISPFLDAIPRVDRS
jgi:3-deoxy-D-manno-octulosonic-acid transferase